MSSSRNEVGVDGQMRQSEVAYLRLREDILDGVLAPGVPLLETSIASQLGVSRTPVREALSRLAPENLVTVVPGKGAFVTYISLADIRELFQMRLILEPAAARLAAQRPDPQVISDLLEKFETAPEIILSGDTAAYRKLCGEMDSAISLMTQNQRLQAMLRSTWQEARRVRSATQTNQTRLLASVVEHREILGNMLKGDADATAAAVTRHLERCSTHITQAMASNHALIPEGARAGGVVPDGGEAFEAPIQVIA
jgi:DNA-binding GntR family transcriptional regulator